MSSSMLIEEKNPGRQYGDWNRAFLQMVMVRGYISGQDTFNGVKEIYERFKSSPKFPSIRVDTAEREDMADLIEWFIKMANANLEHEGIPLRLKKAVEEAKSHQDSAHCQYYVLVPDSQDEALSKLQRVFGEQELEWLRLAVEHLIEKEDHMASPTDLINLCRHGGNNSTKKKLTVTEADKTMNMFMDEGYLQKVGSGKKQRVACGPRFLVEMEGWLEEEDRPEGVWRCAKCDKVGMVGSSCTKKECEARFHNYHNLNKCPRCKTAIAATGEAVKRSR